MKQLILIAILFLTACSPYWQPKCRHDALYAASVVGEQEKVRIALGHYYGRLHAQAQALTPDGWMYLVVNHGMIDSKKTIEGFVPAKYFTFEEYSERIGRGFEALS